MLLHLFLVMLLRGEIFVVFITFLSIFLYIWDRLDHLINQNFYLILGLSGPEFTNYCDYVSDGDGDDGGHDCDRGHDHDCVHENIHDALHEDHCVEFA